MTETRSLAGDLKKKTVKELRKLAEGDYDLDVKGLKKAEIVDKIVEHLTEANDEIEDDEFDEEDFVDASTGEPASKVLDDDELDDEEDDELPDEDDGQEYHDLVTAVDQAVDELDDEEDDLPEEPKPAPKKKAAPPEPTGDTLSAKQVATRIGTDAKTLRKFFRSSASTVEAVGAGGRYEFAKEDLDKIKAEFEGWHTNKPARRTKKDENGEKEPRRKVDDIPEEDLEFDEDELDDEELELDDELDDEEED